MVKIGNSMVVEVDTELGRDTFELNTDSGEEMEVESNFKVFLHEHGYQSLEPKSVIAQMKADSSTPRVRMEKLGFTRDISPGFPRIGQAHELEFPGMRTKLKDSRIGHAIDLGSSAKKMNGVTEMKIVSETLGEVGDDATTEIILGPAGTKDEYIGVMSKVDKFLGRVEAEPKGKSITMRQGFESAYSEGEFALSAKGNQAELWHATEDDIDEEPGVHTSRGTPIRAISTVLRHPQSKLPPAPKLLLNLASDETDALVKDLGLTAPRGKKLWETFNLGIWMSACEGVVSPLMGPDNHGPETQNETIKDWTLFAGKNFIGVVSRFTAGDLLRSGGLQFRDLEQVRQLFASPDSEKNAQNFERLVTASKNVVDRFITRFESRKNKEHKEIASILRTKWDTPETGSVTHYIRRDLKSDFWPAQNRTRYPDDEKTYGHKVDADAWSPSFAHTQFVPRRERLGPDNSMDTPVSGVFEFRMPNHAGNQKLEAHFARSKKRPRNALEQSWTAFEAHVDLVKKKRKLG